MAAVNNNRQWWWRKICCTSVWTVIVGSECNQVYLRERMQIQMPLGSGSPLWHNIYFGTNFNLVRQFKAFSIIHDETASGDSAANALWIVVTVNSVDSTFACSV